MKVKRAIKVGYIDAAISAIVNHSYFMMNALRDDLQAGENEGCLYSILLDAGVVFKRNGNDFPELVVHYRRDCGNGSHENITVNIQIEKEGR